MTRYGRGKSFVAGIADYCYKLYSDIRVATRNKRWEGIVQQLRNFRKRYTHIYIHM